MKLYLVPTPIGNLEDITLRAIRVLGEVDGILAEDTRNSGQLLKHLNISKPLYSHHAHNEHTGVPGVIKMLKEGKSLALISDAGTPAISDPGFLITRACIENGIEVECLPGATAFVPALVNSGLPNDKFIFDPNLNQPRTQNLLLNIKTNLIRINIDGVKYLLVKICLNPKHRHPHQLLIKQGGIFYHIEPVKLLPTLS